MASSAPCESYNSGEAGYQGGLASACNPLISREAGEGGRGAANVELSQVSPLFAFSVITAG